MGNSHNNGYSTTIQSDRHSEGGQLNIDTEGLKKTLKVRIFRQSYFSRVTNLKHLGDKIFSFSTRCNIAEELKIRSRSTGLFL